MHGALFIPDFVNIASIATSFTFYLVYIVLQQTSVLIFYTNNKMKLALSVYSKTQSPDIRALNKQSQNY